MSRLDSFLEKEKTTACFNSKYVEWFFVSTSKCIRTATCEDCPAHFDAFVIEGLIKLIEE